MGFCAALLISPAGLPAEGLVSAPEIVSAPAVKKQIEPWVPWAIAGGLTAATLLVDRSIHREVSTHGNNSIDKILGTGRFGRRGTIGELIGEPHVTIGMSGLFYAGGAIAGSERAKRVGVAGVEAAVASGLLVLAVKGLVGRNRPYTGDDADEYRPFRGSKNSRASFPSGHATTAFAMASVVADEYDNFWVDFLSYGYAVTVGVGRIYQNNHWASDVAAGALLGTWVGKSVSRWEKRSGKMRRLYTDGRGLYFARRF